MGQLSVPLSRAGVIHLCPVPDTGSSVIEASWCFSARRDALLALPEDLQERDILHPSLLLYQAGPLSIYYAPFDWVNAEAKVTIVGITPGRHEMWLGCRAAREAARRGLSESATLREAKATASFGGRTRINLVQMLDGIGLADALGITTCGECFGEGFDLVDITSALLYPVIIRGENYTGAHPTITSSPILREFVDRVLANELSMRPRSLVIPLGDAASGAVEKLIDSGKCDAQRLLRGFPHPSGANGHRKRLYTQRREGLTRIVKEWATSL